MRSGVVLLAALPIGAPSAVARQSASPAGAAGTGFIMGRVVDSTSGAPIIGAVVTINGAALDRPASPFEPGPAGRGPRSTLVDSQGRFLFRNVPQGTFTFAVDAAGYSLSRPGRGAESWLSNAAAEWELQEGGQLGGVILRLARLGAIAGTVIDEAGEPVIGIDVRAYRRTVVAGRVRLIGAGSASTDDRGAFRIPRLPSTDYVVGTYNSTTTMPVETAGRLGRPGIQIGDVAIVPSGVGLPGASALVAAGAVRVYPSKFYPSALVPTEAALVKVGSGEERTGVAMRLEATPSVRVSGTVTGPLGPASKH
jgi:hypothetical protein